MIDFIRVEVRGFHGSAWSGSKLVQAYIIAYQVITVATVMRVRREYRFFGRSFATRALILLRIMKYS